MKKLIIAITTVMAMMITLLTPSGVALADNEPTADNAKLYKEQATETSKECAGVHTYFDWECGKHGGDDGFSQVLLTIYNWMAAAVSVGVIIGIIFGAIMYASAGGNEAQTKNAIAAIRNSIIALVLFFLMWSFLNYITPGGFFS